MGDIYHAGEVYAGSVPIDDTKTSDKSTWSSQKINDVFGCNKTTAGTYALQCTVDSSGNKTYKWV